MIATSVQAEGFESILYPGSGRKDKVLIVMSGSNGGKRSPFCLLLAGTGIQPYGRGEVKG